MPNNLARPRPDQRLRGDPFHFIEECWSNSIAFVALKDVVAAQLTGIEIFFVIHNTFKPTNET